MRRGNGETPTPPSLRALKWLLKSPDYLIPGGDCRAYPRGRSSLPGFRGVVVAVRALTPWVQVGWKALTYQAPNRVPVYHPDSSRDGERKRRIKSHELVGAQKALCAKLDELSGVAFVEAPRCLDPSCVDAACKLQVTRAYVL